jgi:hypothetical protein
MEVGAGKTFTLKGLSPGATYVIEVKSIPKKGAPSEWSRPIKFNTNSKGSPPPNVTNLAADFKGNTLVVTWDGSAARAEKDFKHFRIRVTSPDHTGVTKNYFTDSNVFKFQEDQNRDVFGSYEGSLSITVYSLDRTGNQSSGVSISASSEPPEDPTNVTLNAATLGYNVAWNLPTFPNYYGTRIYQSATQNGTYALVKTEYGSSTFVSYTTFTEVWVKVAHINSAGLESNRVAPTPPSVTPINPVSADVTPPADPSNLNWEDPESDALNTSNGITTASKRAHWQVSEPTSGYKVRVSENAQNWAVYDVPAISATVTNKSASGTTATLTVTANSFAVNDYITVFGLGTPFDGKFKVTSRTSTSINYTLPSSHTIASTPDEGQAIVSSYIVKELNPGTTYYGSILAYDSSNNLSQFVSQGTFATSGTAAQLGSAIKIGGTTMAFGPAAGGSGNNGLHINSSNYWYTTGSFKVGTTGNSMTWDGVKLSLDGGISARSGIFSGNVFISSGNASLIAADSITVQSGTWSSGVATITLADPVPGLWQSGNVIVIAQTGSSFDGQYVIQGTPSGNNVSFTMPNAPVTYPVFNAGAVSNVSVGDRVVFNSNGIQGLTGSTAKFTLEQNGSLDIVDITAEGINLSGGTRDHAVTNFGTVRYSIFSQDGRDILLKAITSPAPGQTVDPAKIRWLDSESNQRGTMGFDAAGSNANKFVIRAIGLSSPNNGNMLIDAGGAGTIDLSANSVTINGEEISGGTSGSITNRYKNGMVASPSVSNRITFGTDTAGNTNTNPQRGDVHLKY